jgi:hypothetical protein
MKPDLPIGQQYFGSIRKNNYLYVDKTQYIYELCRLHDKNYFLSRPCRFGKSLTLDTIAELFQGNKALFEGRNQICPRFDFFEFKSPFGFDLKPQICRPLWLYASRIGIEFCSLFGNNAA